MRQSLCYSQHTHGYILNYQMSQGRKKHITQPGLEARTPHTVSTLTTELSGNLVGPMTLGRIRHLPVALHRLIICKQKCVFNDIIAVCPPVFVTNASLSSDNEKNIDGTTVKITCNNGYVYQGGESTLVCSADDRTKNATWNGHVGKCLKRTY